MPYEMTFKSFGGKTTTKGGLDDKFLARMALAILWNDCRAPDVLELIPLVKAGMNEPLTGSPAQVISSIHGWIKDRLNPMHGGGRHPQFEIAVKTLMSFGIDVAAETQDLAMVEEKCRAFIKPWLERGRALVAKQSMVPSVVAPPVVQPVVQPVAPVLAPSVVPEVP